MAAIDLAQTSLAEAVHHEVEKYVADSYKAVLHFTFNPEQQLYCVTLVPDYPRPFPARVVVMAQIIGDYVVILEETTDKPLVDALMVNAGIPRDKIILAYRGEKLPDINASTEKG